MRWWVSLGCRSALSVKWIARHPSREKLVRVSCSLLKLIFINKVINREETSDVSRAMMNEWMNESKKFNSIGREECLVRGESTKINFGVCADPHVVIKHHHTNAFMLFTHRKIHHHYPLFLLLFLYFTLGRKQVASTVLVLGGCTPTMRVDGGLKESKSVHASCEKSLLVNGRIVRTSTFGNAAFSLHEASHTSKCFQGFLAAAFFKRPNKLELLNRGWPTAYGASDVFGWQTKLNELVSIVASGRRRTFTWKVPCGDYETKWKSCDENVMKMKNNFPDEN